MTTIRAHRARRAFTLVEALIAVAAVALIAVAIGSIFEAASDTVQAGKRQSRLTTFAARFEQQFREDLTRVRRDGFMVIRNEFAIERDTRVPLSPDEPTQSQRERRIDEIMFFRSGDFRTKRSPVHPAREPRATTARIYYGHGLRRELDANGGLRPQLSADNVTANAPRFGEPASDGGEGVNQYASDWTLLRHVTLLVEPSDTQEDPPLPFIQELGGFLRDTQWQIGLQPAAPNLFRTMIRQTDIDDCFPLAENDSLRGNDEGVPSFESGLVDIAAVSMAYVRGVVMTGLADPDSFFVLDEGPSNSEADDIGLYEILSPDALLSGVNVCNVEPNLSLIRGNAIAISHAWMLDALPAASQAWTIETDWNGSSFVPSVRYTPRPADNRRRVRYEPEPPDALGAIGDPPFDADYERVDQLMLARHNFMPNCTEFLVEWTFGEIDEDDDTLIWHDIEKAYDPVDDPDALHLTPYVALNGEIRTHPVSNLLIHGVRENGSQLDNDGETLRSFFGVVDPYFEPNVDGPNNRDVNDDGLYQPWMGDRTDEPERIAWAWPKMIRVTLSLVDPSRPDEEERFQFVFEVPEGPDDAF